MAVGYASQSGGGKVYRARRGKGKLAETVDGAHVILGESAL
jgi:hypothetical protein